MIKRGKKKGQVTIFIIIAILIVALGILIYLYYPKLFPGTGTETKNPAAYMQECMQREIEDTTQTVIIQGGNYTVNPNAGIFYKNAESDPDGHYIRYLCYSGEDFTPCINQEPFLTEHIESEILNTIKPSIENCFTLMVESYEKKGYDVNLQHGNSTVSIIPEVISTDFNTTLTLTKGDEVQTYKKFQVNLDSNLYDMLEVAKNIIIWEINVGDSATEAYMYDNPALKVEKHRKDNDVKVYVLTDRDTREVFQFASRSFANPAGFGNVNEYL